MKALEKRVVKNNNCYLFQYIAIIGQFWSPTYPTYPTYIFSTSGLFRRNYRQTIHEESPSFQASSLTYKHARLWHHDWTIRSLLLPEIRVNSRERLLRLQYREKQSPAYFRRVLCWDAKIFEKMAGFG